MSNCTVDDKLNAVEAQLNDYFKRNAPVSNQIQSGEVMRRRKKYIYRRQK